MNSDCCAEAARDGVVIWLDAGSYADIPGWFMRGGTTFDGDSHFTAIKFCPFCGKKLEEQS